jgi:hypothetical protein
VQSNRFFYCLHKSVANEKGFKPAKEEELKVNDMHNLGIGSIMAAIIDKINK